jgi:AraC-like DNA-binding protein
MVVPMVSLFELSHAVALLDAAASPLVVDRGLRAAGLSRKMLRGKRGFLPYTVEAVLVEHVARALGDPLLGARLGGSYDYGAYDAYARYVLGAGTLRAALERGARAFPLIHPGCEVVLRAQGEHLLVGRTSGMGSLVGAQHLDDAALPIIGQLLGHFLGPDWRPDWVETVGHGPRRADDIADLLGVQVRRADAIPAVAVRLRDLDTPNPHLLAANEAVGFADLPVLMGHAPPETVADTVRCVLVVQFGTGDLSEDCVARQLGMGRRTLQRALQSEGTSFRKVKARVIEGRARRLLAETQLDIEAIARALGYDEPNSFRRAFRGWTGLTPNAFRAGLGQGAPSGAAGLDHTPAGPAERRRRLPLT